jgi:Holliday junction resolvase
MGKASRDKGVRRERQLIELHRVLGIKAQRVPLSGAVRYQGNGADVDVYVRGPEAPPWVGEVKARASGEGFATIKRWLDDADFLALVEDRAQPLIVLPWARWEELLLALKGRQP